MIVEEINIDSSDEQLMCPLKKEFPVLNIAPSLPVEIKNAITDELNRISSMKGKSPPSILDSYEYETRYITTLGAVFDGPKAVLIWNDLFKKSPKSTLLFIGLLFSFEKTYEFGVEFYKQLQQDIKDLKSQIRCAENLFQVMKRSKENLNTDLMKQLIYYEADAREHLVKNKFALKNDSHFKNGFCPLSRKKNVENAFPIYIVRKMYYVFRTEFGMAMYSHISKFISVMFGLDWDENEVKKHCKRINSFIRG
ncbi:TPA: hypothetical protein ACM2VO_003366 [Legionella pneumophila]